MNNTANIYGLPFNVYEYINKKFTHLPFNESGVYMICTLYGRKKIIHYIGSTDCLRTRITSHEKIKALKGIISDKEKICILFYKVKSLFRFLEKWLINKYRPKMNTNGGFVRPNNSSLMRYIIITTYRDSIDDHRIKNKTPDEMERIRKTYEGLII